MPMKIDWNQVDKEINSVTMDADGQIKWGGEIPTVFNTSRYEGWVYERQRPIYLLGTPEFPASALLEPYHPKNWKTSLTKRPKEWDYTAMAERRQFGVFMKSTYGRLTAYMQWSLAPFLRDDCEWCSTFTPMTEPRPLEEEE